MSSEIIHLTRNFLFMITSILLLVVFIFLFYRTLRLPFEYITILPLFFLLYGIIRNITRYFTAHILVFLCLFFCRSIPISRYFISLWLFFSLQLHTLPSLHLSQALWCRSWWCILFALSTAYPSSPIMKQIILCISYLYSDWLLWVYSWEYISCVRMRYHHQDFSQNVVLSSGVCPALLPRVSTLYNRLWYMTLH